MSADAFRDYLERGDVQALWDAWPRAAPHLPQPLTYADAEITMHIARTAARSVKFDARAYSHRWLTERDLPSQLPDSFRPAAERLYPRVVDAVGLSVNFNSPQLAPVAEELQREIGVSIATAYADGQTDPSFVRQRMTETRDRVMRKLFGR